MIKKVYILVVLLFSFATVCYANTNYDIKLSIDENLCKNKEIIIDKEGDKIKCNIRFEVTRNEDNGDVKVDVNFETVGDSKYDLVLFCNEYKEQELKNVFPKKKLKFDGSYPGKPQKIRKSDKIKDNFYVVANVDEHIMTFDHLEEDGNAEEIKLCIYAVEHRTKRFLFWTSHKYNIVGKEDITFNVNVTSPIINDSVADSIINNYSELIEERIGNTTFCNNPNHKPTLKEQKDSFLLQINSLKSQLDSIIENSDFNDCTKNFYKKHRNLMNEDLDSIMQKEDCGKHVENRKAKKTFVNRGHSCKYCNMSLEEIYKIIESIYTGIYTGSTTNKQNISEVEVMYNCAKGHKDWETSKAAREAIVDYYKKIKNEK